MKRINTTLSVSVLLFMVVVTFFSCKKNDYGIASYQKPSTANSSNSIFDDSSKYRLIPNVGNWDSKVNAYEDLQYDAFLTRNNGWNGGDGNFSHLLPDSSILWTFQDSFFGFVDNTRNRPSSQNVFVRNAGIIQKKGDISSFVQLNSGSLNNSKTWIQYDNLVSNDTKEVYWPGGGHVVNGSFQVLLSHLSYNASGGLDFTSVDLAIFSLPDMVLQKVVKNKYVGAISFDSNIYDDEDGYTYIYGSIQDFLEYKLYVARVPNHDLTGTWQFLTSKGWGDAPDNYYILEDEQTLPNIVKSGSTYYLISQQVVYGRNVYAWSGSSPVGPFSNRKTLYQIPQNSKVLTYNTTVHQELAKEGELIIAYNNNPINFADNFNTPGSADYYKPYVVRLRNWK